MATLNLATAAADDGCTGFMPSGITGGFSYQATNGYDGQGKNGTLYSHHLVRFAGLTIPPGSTITSATLGSEWLGTSTAGSVGEIYRQDIASAPAWSDGQTISGGSYALGTAHVTMPTVTGAGHVDYDVTAILVEQIAASGWASGNAMRFILNADPAAGYAQIENYEWASVATFTLAVDYAPFVWTGVDVRGVGAYGHAAGAVTPVLPSYQAGDRLLLFVHTANQVPTPPGDWTAVANFPTGGGTAASTIATRLSVFTKVAGGSESAPTVAFTGDHVGAFIMATTPADVHVTAANSVTTNSSSVAYPSVTTTVAGCLLLAASVTDTDIATPRLSSITNGFVEDADYSTTDGNGGGIQVAHKYQTVIGATGTTTGTLATASRQSRGMIALSPSSAAVPNPRSWAMVIG